MALDPRMLLLKAQQQNARLTPDMEKSLARLAHPATDYACTVVKGVFEIGEPQIAENLDTTRRYLAMIAEFEPEQYAQTLRRLYAHQQDRLYVVYTVAQFEMLDFAFLLQNNISFTLQLLGGADDRHFVNQNFANVFLLNKGFCGSNFKYPQPKTFLDTLAELEEIGETYPIVKEKLEAALTELQRNQQPSAPDSEPTITL